MLAFLGVDDRTMTGPEHYVKAEEYLSEAVEIRDANERAQVLQRAQVHAMLALAAATALGSMPAGSARENGYPAMGYEDGKEWTTIAGAGK